MKNQFIPFSFVEKTLRKNNIHLQYHCQPENLNENELELFHNNMQKEFEIYYENAIKYGKIIKIIEKDHKVVGFINAANEKLEYCDFLNKEATLYQCFLITESKTYLSFAGSIEYFDFLSSYI